MTNLNHWGTFKDSLARWDLEFPAAMWSRWQELLAFADGVFALGQREAVLMLDQVPSLGSREHELFGDIVPATRLSVFGPSGIQDRVVRDLRPELLVLRPDLDPASIPHASALTIKGPLLLDPKGPVEVSISIHSDIWFPRVVGIHDESDDDAPPWYDNAAVAALHTPRLNQFLSGVRLLAEALDATWSCEATRNRSYTAMVDERGILLE